MQYYEHEGLPAAPSVEASITQALLIIQRRIVGSRRTT
jgi:hypothetical protein